MRTKPPLTLRFKDNLLSLETPLVMGILNATPDSFYEGSRLAKNSETQILRKAQKVLDEGASIIDVGGYSTRPNAEDISLEEEMQRVVSVVSAIKKNFPDAIVSIDTFRSEVARAAIENGADLINDVSGGNLDKKMFQTVADLKVPYILMHMRGTPQTMKNQTDYQDILLEIMNYFEEKINQLKALGVEEIILDAGFGFAKTIQQNYFLLKNLSVFEHFDLPLLVGISRKSMIYKKLGISVSEALNGTTILNTIALQNGAGILRVHDVKEAKEAVRLLQLLS